MAHLGSIAEIRMGATLRGRDATRPDPNGTYRFLRIGDISQDGVLRTDELVTIEPNEPINQELWLRRGDVLFPNRGTRTTALAFPLDEPRTIAGPQFFIVRIDAQKALPAYVAWFLRSPEAATHFDARRKGTYVQIIERKDLAELEIPLPLLSVQRQIVAIAELALQERQLTEELSHLRWTYSNARLVAAARGASDSPPPLTKNRRSVRLLDFSETSPAPAVQRKRKRRRMLEL
jgi:restriction endonuclease S subunit